MWQHVKTKFRVERISLILGYSLKSNIYLVELYKYIINNLTVHYDMQFQMVYYQ